MNTRVWVAFSFTVAASCAVAQEARRDTPWTGFYVSGSVGMAEPDNDGGAVLFDTTLDGNFGDTVRTVAGVDAFSPGFCGGAALGATPGAGCVDDEDGTEVAVRVGYDWQLGRWVVGALGEYATYDTRDSVSAFSTTPAFYTMTRELDNTFSLRGRVGAVFGVEDRWLAYFTGGGTRASIERTFTTSNGVNAFELREESSSSDGLQAGIGVERRVTDALGIGLHWLRTEIDDQDFRVRATRGNAPATNPFILTNPNGTDFARSDDAYVEAVRVSVSWSF